MPSRALFILRMAFLLVAAGLSILLIKRYDIAQPPWLAFVVFGGVMAAALTVIGLDMLAPRKQVGTISAVYFGVLVGLFLTYLLGLALEPLPLSQRGREAVQLVGGISLCYACTSLLLQTKNDFRFVIPYIEFSKEVKGLKPYILDTSVVIDGRIADVVSTKLIDRQLVMPRFVLSELQAIADSSDKTRRSRGRRGLDILNALRSNEEVDLEIFDRELPEFVGQPVDMKLVMLAKHLDGKVVTNDYNLNKVARLHGVGVVNLNDIANALKPVFLPGEAFDVKIMKTGEGAGQGVGYLDDGTMVVIEGGREFIGQSAHITVTNVLQTSAGRIVFSKFESLCKA